MKGLKFMSKHMPTRSTESQWFCWFCGTAHKELSQEAPVRPLT